MSVQIIEKNGRPEWAVIPYDEYRRLLEALEDHADAAALAEAARRLAAGKEERLPAEMVERLLVESPYKVWREHRRMTLEAVAEAAGLTKAYLSMIEAGKRQPSAAARARIAAALGIGPDDLD
jgi:DNA-binding XRE family transcriptional regulator